MRTHEGIIDAARRIFLDKGYAATTMPAIAQAAGVALDTVYATAGKKPALFRLLIEMAIAGDDGEVPVEEREYVRAIRARPDEKASHLRCSAARYSAAARSIVPRAAGRSVTRSGTGGIVAEHF